MRVVAWVREGVLAWVRERNERCSRSLAARRVEGWGGGLPAWVRGKGERYL